LRTERRTFRPFDVPAELSSFLALSRLRAGETSDYVDAGSQRLVDVAELRACDFTLEVTHDDAPFDAAREAAVAAAHDNYGENTVEYVVLVSSSYLKLADVALRVPLAEAPRISLLADCGARAFNSIHHGCDIDAFLVLGERLEHQPLRPWRRGTWLSRATFRLRTELEGVGFTILPLTDEKRTELQLPTKTLRYVALDESPLEAPSIATVTLYVDADLLAHLNKTPRKSWAKAFTDQLAVDVLNAVAMRAVADPQIQEATWESLEDKLLGSLLMMVGGKTQGEAEKRANELLDILRANPTAFLARIEGALEMRDSASLIAGVDR
jgi:hypothetical protein